MEPVLAAPTEAWSCPWALLERARIQSHANVQSSEILGEAEVLVGAEVKHCRIGEETKIVGRVANAWFGGKTYIGKDEIVESGRHEDVIMGTLPSDDADYLH